MYCFVETFAAKMPSFGSKEDSMLGIESPGVWMAYLLSVAGAVLCVGYGALNWNKGEEPVRKEDVDWAREEKEEVEDSL